MQKIKETTYPGLKSIRVYGMILVLLLGVLHLSAYFSIRWVETNEIRNELVQWSQTLPTTNAAQPTADVHLPQDIFALHVKTLDRTGFYETRTDEGYLVYANPENNYILAKSKESINRELTNFAITLGSLFAGELVLLFGWWMFAKAKVRELFEVV